MLLLGVVDAAGPTEILLGRWRCLWAMLMPLGRCSCFCWTLLMPLDRRRCCWADGSALLGNVDVLLGVEDTAGPMEVPG
jgi:hypothetical protein